MKSTSRSRARLSLVLLLYVLGIAAFTRLAPFRFGVPGTVRVLITADWRDAVSNVLLFVPMGFLYPLTRRAVQSSVARVALTACVVSAAIETLRLGGGSAGFSVVGVLANAAGAAIGAELLRAGNQRILASRLAGRLSLEIPLVGLVYLLVPLLFVVSLSVGDDSASYLALLPLGLLGARLIASVQEFHFGPAGAFRNRMIPYIAGGWAIAGSFPALLRAPLLGGALVAVVALASWNELARPAIHGIERRFEIDVLRRSVPYLAGYLLVIALLPLAAGLSPWHLSANVMEPGGDEARRMVRLLEPVASFTVIGYLLAEQRGRRELPFRAIAPRVVLECAALAIAIEACCGFQPGGASGARVALRMAASLLGAALYHNQRERVRWILIGRAADPGRVSPARIVSAV